MNVQSVYTPSRRGMQQEFLPPGPLLSRAGTGGSGRGALLASPGAARPPLPCLFLPPPPPERGLTARFPGHDNANECLLIFTSIRASRSWTAARPWRRWRAAPPPAAMRRWGSRIRTACTGRSASTRRASPRASGRLWAWSCTCWTERGRRPAKRRRLRTGRTAAGAERGDGMPGGPYIPGEPNPRRSRGRSRRTARPTPGS